MGKFPDGFLWGAATSSHQVEGDNFYNDWWEWERKGGTEPSGKACGHYRLFREDFRIAKELGHNAHRFGIEWSRLEKNEGSWDEAEWGHYGEVVDELLRLGIEPIATLNHFTLPLWLARRGGWENERSAEFFGRFAAKAVEKLGNRVRRWITINEPLVLAYIGYFQGKWPPCKQNPKTMDRVIETMLEAHIASYKMMKAAAKLDRTIKKPEIGLAHAVSAFHPCSRSSVLDRVAAFLRANYQNHWFIWTAVKKNSLDFIGLNYYFREFVHHKNPVFKNPFGYLCSHEHHEDAGRRTNMGWEIYPKGIYEVVKSFRRYKLPIMITENGVSTDDDDLRKEFIRDHLLYLSKAMEEGANVIGYLHWSLLDNFEWADGYSRRFGLVGVDFATEKRTVRGSGWYLAQLILQ